MGVKKTKKTKKSYVDTQEHAIIMPGSVFILPPYTHEKKTIWTTLGSNPAYQLRKKASTLSITPLPLGQAFGLGLGLEV